MAISRNYADIEEALKDIDSIDRFASEFDINEKCFSLDHLYDHFTEFRRLIFDGYHKDIDLGIVLEVSYMIWELMKNAYRSSMSAYPKSCFKTEAFIGSKGVLVGTQQETEFLTQQQIMLLKEGRNVPSTKIEPPKAGMGTRILVNYGDGVLISEAEKAVYFSKYFSQA